MRKIIVFLLLLLILVPEANALTTNLTASVGKYYFSVSGYVSPFASIVMSSNTFFMASTVADSKGNFAINNVFVNEGFTDFCLEAIDVKRIGDSYTCFKISPVKSDGVKKENIFLPPTLGLSGKKINPGSSIFASGYTMPYATVKINISKDIEVDTIADKTGFYKYEIKDIPAGKYSLFATANHETRFSEKPSKTKELESLSAGFIRENLWILLLIVLIVIAVIILLLILLSRRLREKLRNLLLRRPIGKKKIIALKHHSWFLGY